MQGIPAAFPHVPCWIHVSTYSDPLFNVSWRPLQDFQANLRRCFVNGVSFGGPSRIRIIPSSFSHIAVRTWERPPISSFYCPQMLLVPIPPPIFPLTKVLRVNYSTGGWWLGASMRRYPEWYVLQLLSVLRNPKS